MSKQESFPELTKAEFNILRVLWKNGRLSVREVHDRLAETSQWAYSTTKTIMDRMDKKGLLKRESFHGVFLYKPLISRTRGFARFIQFFAERVLELDHSMVVSLFAHSEALTPAEIEELATMLEDNKNKEQT
jgi:BlaI family penicillinase repressor